MNYIKTSEVIRQQYPLQIRANGPHTYFMKRETWGWTDFLMNPMVKKVDEVALSLTNMSDAGFKTNFSPDCNGAPCIFISLIPIMHFDLNFLTIINRNKGANACFPSFKSPHHKQDMLINVFVKKKIC